MKAVTINISPRSDERGAIEALDRKLQRFGALVPADLLLVNEAKKAIRDFVERAHQHYASGTTIKISKEFQLSRAKLFVHLDCPDQRNTFRQLMDLLRSQ